MDSDTDDETAFLRPRLRISQKSLIPVVEISNRLATVFGDYDYPDNGSTPMRVQETNINGVARAPTGKKKTRKRNGNKLPDVQATNYCGETKDNSNRSCGDVSETCVVEDQVPGSGNVSGVHVAEYLDQGDTSERNVADVSVTLCDGKQVECQTTITGDVFALNFYQESDSVVGTIPGGGMVDQLITLQDIEACLSAVQASFANPCSLVETESCSVQMDTSTRVPVSSGTPALDSGLQSCDSRELQNVQTEVREAKTYAHQSVQVLVSTLRRVDKSTQTECSELQTSGVGEAKTDQIVQTEFQGFVTWGSEDGNHPSMTLGLTCSVQQSNISQVAHHPCYCSNPSSHSRIVGSAASIDAEGRLPGNDGENANTERSDATGERRRLWLNVMFKYVAVPLVVLRLAFLGACLVFNCFRYFF